jgi:hypothetical protein
LRIVTPLDHASAATLAGSMSDAMQPPLLPGQRLARGVQRLLRAHDFASLAEFVPAPGLRVDVIGLGPRGEVWIVECKSSREDFMSDGKWKGYLPWCDRFFWATDATFPVELLPAESGLILADDFDAEIQRWPEPTPLAGARRKALVQRFARTAAGRLLTLTDPGPAGAAF